MFGVAEGRRRVGEEVTSQAEGRRGPKRPTYSVGYTSGSFFSWALGPISWSVGQCSPRGTSPSTSGCLPLPRQSGRA